MIKNNSLNRVKENFEGEEMDEIAGLFEKA